VECEIFNHVSFHPWLAGTVHVVNLLYWYWIDISVLPLNRHISVCEGVYEYLWRKTQGFSAVKHCCHIQSLPLHHPELRSSSRIGHQRQKMLSLSFSLALHTHTVLK